MQPQEIKQSFHTELTAFKYQWSDVKGKSVKIPEHTEPVFIEYKAVRDSDGEVEITVTDVIWNGIHVLPLLLAMDNKDDLINLCEADAAGLDWNEPDQDADHCDSDMIYGDSGLIIYKKVG